MWQAMAGGKGLCSRLRIGHVPAILPHPGRFFPHKAPMVNYDQVFVHILCARSRAWW